MHAGVAGNLITQGTCSLEGALSSTEGCQPQDASTLLTYHGGAAVANALAGKAGGSQRLSARQAFGGSQSRRCEPGQQALCTRQLGLLVFDLCSLLCLPQLPLQLLIPAPVSLSNVFTTTFGLSS